MEIAPKISGPRTPVKQSNPSKSMSKKTENLNPNVSNSPIKDSTSKSRKFAAKNPTPTSVSNSPSKKNRIRERKFVVAKSKSNRALVNKETKGISNCECKQAKCLCLAYESLRASQEEFIKNGRVISNEMDVGLANKGDLSKGCLDKVEVFVIEKDASFVDESINGDEGLFTKRSTDNLVEEGKVGGSEGGSRRVMHLVEAFEKMLSLPKSNSHEEEKEEKDGDDKGTKSEFLSLQQLSPKVPETELSASSFCPSDCLLTSECLGLNSYVSASSDSGCKQNSGESSGAYGRGQWKRRQQLKKTAYIPFKLMTEERGKSKEEYFRKKVQQMMEEEEKLRIPLAQGLPRTTDEPECLMKPPIKEITMPLDLVLHSDIRAEERAGFDQQVAEKMSFGEQYKRERERQQKLAEEEEIRRLRKELVHKAQPMPYFDRPFFAKKVSQAPHHAAKFSYINGKASSKTSINSWSDGE